MKTYNGHRSWNAWNVALWINNDESLYNHALDCLSTSKGNTRRATRKFLNTVDSKTPDGARYNYLSVFNTLEDLNN